MIYFYFYPFKAFSRYKIKLNNDLSVLKVIYNIRPPLNNQMKNYFFKQKIRNIIIARQTVIQKTIKAT